MFASDQDDTNSTKLSTFDISRLEDMTVGDSLEIETGNARILRYKDNYVVMLFDSKSKREFTELSSKEEVIKFLNK